MGGPQHLGGDPKIEGDPKTLGGKPNFLTPRPAVLLDPADEKLLEEEIQAPTSSKR